MTKKHKKKYKKNNHNHMNTKSMVMGFSEDSPCIRKYNQMVEIPYTYLLRRDIYPLANICRRFDEFDPVDCNIIPILTDLPNYQTKSEITEKVVKPLIGYFFKLVSDYPQALMYLRHRKKNCTDDLTNAINVLDFYSDYHRLVDGLISFDLVITELCNYLKSKGKTLSEIFEIVINEVAYPIGVPVDVEKFEFENIPDMETMIIAILDIYKFCRDYMDMTMHSMNFNSISVNYDKTTKVISVNCE